MWGTYYEANKICKQEMTWLGPARKQWRWREMLQSCIYSDILPAELRLIERLDEESESRLKMTVRLSV